MYTQEQDSSTAPASPSTPVDNHPSLLECLRSDKTPPQSPHTPVCPGAPRAPRAGANRPLTWGDYLPK
jgi:hypothetical protein